MIVAGSLGIVQASAQAATIATTAAAVTPDAAAPAPAESAAAGAGTAATPANAPQQLRADVATAPKPMVIGAHAPQAPGLGGAAVALLLVVGLILGLAWVLKRMPGSSFRQAEGLRVVANIPLGARERAAVVQVGGEQLLIGIGAGGVRTLHVLPEPLPTPAPTQLPSLGQLPDFKQLLAQRLRKDS